MFGVAAELQRLNCARMIARRVFACGSRGAAYNNGAVRCFARLRALDGAIQSVTAGYVTAAR